MQQTFAPCEVPTVFVVDPDPSTAETVKSHLDGFNVVCEAFQTCQDFLAAFSPDCPGCLVLEQHIADMSGYQLQRRLAAQAASLPFVFAIARPDVSTVVEMMRGGAVHVLEKPLRPIELVNAIQEALDLDRERRSQRQREARVRNLVAELTPKECEVLEMTAQGRTIRSIAAALDLCVRAVEQRRQRLMAKLEVRTQLELMRFSVIAQQILGSSLATTATSADEVHNARSIATLALSGRLPRRNGTCSTKGEATVAVAPEFESDLAELTGVVTAVRGGRKRKLA